MQSFLYKINQFMSGRNGIDGFGIFLLILSFITKNIAYFTQNYLINILTIVIVVFLIYRIFSTNLPQRQKENDFFMKIFRNVYSWFSSKSTLAKERAKVRETHKIYVCPKCKRFLKVPRHKGKIEISCPCSYKFHKRT
ncbi:MAG: hypothetical protein SOZ34_05840 [Clostridia bacterium]|nr:hypothetical protein [Clostridia bacterium]